MLRFSPGWSCHPTFAMTGALAWQVKQNLNKKRNLLVSGGIARELPGVSPLCVVCAPFSFCLYLLPICRSTTYSNTGRDGYSSGYAMLTLQSIEVLSNNLHLQSVCSVKIDEEKHLAYCDHLSSQIHGFFLILWI